jgi:nicotinamidase-related amidase
MGRTALLIVDMISSFDFEDGEKVAESAHEAVPHITDLARRARDEGVPIAYVNDNYGGWSDTRDDLIERMRAGQYSELLEPLTPAEDVAFVLKGRHSIFYGTPVEHMLREEGVDRIVMTGVVTEQCILYSALDAYLRHFQVVVPRDAVAHISEHLAEAALEMMESNLHAEVVDADEVDFTSSS